MKKARIVFLVSVTAMILGTGAFIQMSTSGRTKNPEIVVYQSRTCGCCKKWVDHLKTSGLNPISKFVDDVTVTKLKMNLPMKLASCHTAVVNGYIIEGHVPASAIHKLLAAKPVNVKGLAVPGMPMGSPGMEGSYKAPFNVLAFESNGSERIFMNF